MELQGLIHKLKLDHLELHLDTLCEQAAARELDYRAFLTEALFAEWRGRQSKGVDARLKQARLWTSLTGVDTRSMPKVRTNDLALPRLGGEHTAAASHRDHYERCEALRHELGLTARGMRVALYLLESPSHTLTLTEFNQVFGCANQMLGIRGYNRVFKRRVEYGGKPGLRTTWLELTEEARATIERGMVAS